MQSEMSEIKQSMNEMKRTVEKFAETCMERVSYQGETVEATKERSNPWARHTTKILTAAMERNDKEVSQRYAAANFETYQPTIDALSSSPSGLSANEVAHTTKRSRSIESAYLWKLHLAGLISRKKCANKVKYILRDRTTVLRAFGISQ